MNSFMTGWMTGWKVWTGAGMIIVSGVLQYFNLLDQAELLMKLGEALVLIGIGHKIEKAANGKTESKE